jgi:glycosyltransferase involved in cell wall biosynthesis
MKVGIAAPLSLAAVNGGVRTQVTQTAQHLKSLNVEVEYIHFDQINFDYDLIHVFSASPETIGIAKQAVSSDIKLVVSPVFFSNRSAATISASLKVEKTVSGIGSGIRSDFGIKSEICNWANAVLPNTESELKLVRDGLKVEASKLKVIPNGVESRFLNATPDLFEKTYGIKNFVLFVGQAGAERKNVLQLIKTAADLDTQIVIIGSFYQNEYSTKCLELANSSKNILLIESLEHDDPLLESAYAASKVFCLPSLYETPGIAAMEAALTGSEIVITKYGGTKEYFGDFARYVNPDSSSEIRSAILKSLDTLQSDSLRNHVRNNFTWEMVASKTLDIYKSLS